MAQVSFRIDDKIKRDAEQVCDDVRSDYDLSEKAWKREKNTV